MPQRRARQTEFHIANFYGMRVPARAGTGMTELEKRLLQEFKDRSAREADHAKQGDLLRRGVLGQAEGNQDVAAAVKAYRQAQGQHARRKLAIPRTRPAKQRIFTSSIGATVVPPYNWPWTWTAGNGTPAALSATASQASGAIGLSAWTSFNNGSNAAARGAVGIFFRPPTSEGFLRLWSNPAINFDWGTWCVFDGAHSDGFIGFYVGEYDLSGGFVGAPIDQTIQLWSDDSWWAGVGFQTGSNSGFPLFAQLVVDSNHFYEIWVWCGVYVSAAGWGSPFWGSGAGADLSVAVPSITWELF